MTAPARQTSPDSYASSGSPATKSKHEHVGDSSIVIHKRTYQACIPCRRRKVRCDLGPVDDPHEPPCVRCRRESKECFFSATRRKRKGDRGDDTDALEDDFTARNHRRKTSHLQDSPDISQPRIWHTQVNAPSTSSSLASPVADYNWVGQQRPQPPRSYTEDSGQNRPSPTGEQEVTNETAAALFRSPINNPGDALHLLLEASGRTGDLHRQVSIKDEGDKLGPLRPSRNIVSSTQGPPSKSPQPPGRGEYLQNIDPSITNDASEPEPGSVLHLYRKALRTWSRLRFVRAGWFTAVEAMSYIDYFHDYLEPLSPINPPDFRTLDTSSDLLRDEPMLTVTILTIASRYKTLSGPGGRARSFIIHDRLWEYLQRMISRMFFSQEQFGGGFCGAGQKLGDQGRLRTLGTIESLLLLSEFHPRAMHFPPGDDGDDILAPADADLESLLKTDHDASRSNSIGQSSFTNWTEPALRSDRMCWSLIGAAHTLAYELGLFGSFADAPPINPERSQHLQRILYIYLSQTSGRLGLSSLYHPIAGEDDFASLRRVLSDQNAPSNLSQVDTVVSYWTDVTRIMRVSNLRLFCSKSRTMELIRSGEYIGLLKEFQPILQSWWEKFDHVQLPKYPKIILSIEFEYARVYINSLALQAVLDQWASNASQSHSQSLSSVYKSNEIWIKEVVNASRNLLRQVVDGLLPGDFLKHVPVRTFFRVLSGAMFLLKSFALGAKENEVMASLLLLDRTIKALRTSVVDDVHLCLRIADLLEGLTTSVRHKFVRLAGNSANRISDRGNSPLPMPSGLQTPGSRTVTLRNQSIQQEDGSDIPTTTDPNNTCNKSISILPPPSNAYNLDNNNYIFSSATQLSPLLNQQQQQLYPPNLNNSNNNNNNDNSISSADDWLTLDLNPLLDGNNGGTFGGMDNHWFGNFGPEINANLDVLGRLVNEGFGGDMGF